MIFDKFDIELKQGDVIDLHQTVNGQNVFVILSLRPLDIRYGHDVHRRYEYDMRELLEPTTFDGETEFEIIDNIFNKRTL